MTTTTTTTTATVSPGISNLSDLLTSSKSTSIEYPGYPGFELQLTYLSRDELLKIRKKSVTTKFDRKTRQPIEELDEKLFLQEYTKSIIKGWNGFKLKYVAQMLPIDEDKIIDPENELPYSQENAMALMENASEFDTWLGEVVNDLANFTKNS